MDAEKYQQPELCDINAQIDQLPLLPGVIYELLKLDPEADDFFDRLYQIASNDPPLSAFIIGYANSAASSPNHIIDSLNTALTRVGAVTIIELLTALSVSKVFVPVKKEQKEIWRHSLRVANIASFLSKDYCYKEIKPQTAYMCGLLHDIGRFILFQLAPTALENTEALGWSSPDELIDVEEQSMGFTHCNVGYLACKKLHLPVLVSNIVRYHHHEKVITHHKAPKLLRHMSLIIQIADDVAVLMEKEPDWLNMPREQIKDRIEKRFIKHKLYSHGISIDNLISTLPAIDNDVDRYCQLLGV